MSDDKIPGWEGKMFDFRPNRRLPVRSGYGFVKRARLAWVSAIRYAWRNRTFRGFNNVLVGEMFRLQTDYFPGLSKQAGLDDQ